MNAVRGRCALLKGIGSRNGSIAYIAIKQDYTVSQKTRHQTLGHNFTNCYPIFKFFLPADSEVNLQQIRV